jgi:hypothetical protein
MPEKVALRAIVFREEESRPLPVMARASKREQEVEEVRVMQVTQGRLEVQAPEEEKTVPTTDHTANPLKKGHAPLLNQIILVKQTVNQETDHIVDEMKDHQVVHQIVRLADQKEVQEIPMKDPIAVVQRDPHQNQEIVHSGDQRDLQEIQTKDLIAVVQRDHHQNQEIAHSGDQRDLQEIQTKDHIVVDQKDPHPNLEIVLSEDQKDLQEIPMKDPIAVVPKDPRQNQEIVHSEEQSDLHQTHTKAQFAVGMTGLKGIHKNALLAELKNPLENRMKDHLVGGQKDQQQNQAIVLSKDQKNHFAIRIINHAGTGLKNRTMAHQRVPIKQKDLQEKQVIALSINRRVNGMVRAEHLTDHAEILQKDLDDSLTLVK